MTMRLGPIVFLCAAPLLMALPVPSDQKETTPADEPRYDTSTIVDTMMVVVELKEVASGNPLGGSHLVMRPESSRANSETTDVYLAPNEYLKEFSCRFTKGDRVQVTGSKVKFNGATVVLAREVRLNSTTVYLRDEHGVPYWK